MLNQEGQVISLHLVADGHGPQGHFVSRYIVENFPDTLNRLLIETYTELNS